VNGTEAAAATWIPARSPVVRVPERSLVLLRDLVHARTGMFYDEPRFSFLKDRLSGRAIERGFDSLLDYYYLLKYDSGAEEEWLHAIDALAVQETYFWREFDQLRALTEGILPRLAALRSRPIRIWSMPCASGEEPLSIAMTLTETGWFSRAVIHLDASDASEAALRRARAGRYAPRSFRQLPEPLRARYFEPVGGSNDWTIRPELHARVRSWTRVNAVRDEEMADLAGADVIFCRNLFIYFDQATVSRIVDQLAERMPSPGFLCVAAAESLLRATTRFELQDINGAYIYVKP
jgi:chemotaxis protein methyltransferase CheR